MRLKISSLILSVALLLLASCENKKMQSFDITIVSSGKLSDSPDGLMPSKIISFVKPIECGEIAYIPSVTIIRTDLPNDSVFRILIPKESANEIRSTFGTYDYNNLKDDYEEFLPNLKAGGYLSKEGVSIGNAKPVVYSERGLKFILTSKVSATDSIRFNNSDTIVSVITELICNKKIDLSKKIVILLYEDRSGESVNDTISADSAYAKFALWKMKSQRSSLQLDSALQALERKYPNDYRFTFERLKLKNEAGVIKESDEYLLLLAVEKAIKEGKASDLLELINKMNLPKQTIEKAKQRIKVKPNAIKDSPLPLDKTISFRKSKIDVKLSILADANYSSRDRKLFMDITLEDFESLDSKVNIETLDAKMTVSIKSIVDYLNQLRFSKNYKIEVLSIEYAPNGKISSIRVSEAY